MILNLVHLPRPCPFTQQHVTYVKIQEVIWFNTHRLHHLNYLYSVTPRALYGDPQGITTRGRLGDATADILMTNQIQWHRDCYKDMTHKVHIERLKRQYQEALRIGEAPKEATKSRPIARAHLASPPNEDSLPVHWHVTPDHRVNHMTETPVSSVTANLREATYTKSVHSIQETNLGE